MMGPSGAGKTTLLDVIAGRKTQGRMDGTLLFGGLTASSGFIKRHTAYVEQVSTRRPRDRGSRAVSSPG